MERGLNAIALMGVVRWDLGGIEEEEEGRGGLYGIVSRIGVCEEELTAALGFGNLGIENRASNSSSRILSQPKILQLDSALFNIHTGAWDLNLGSDNIRKEQERKVHKLTITLSTAADTSRPDTVV